MAPRSSLIVAAAVLAMGACIHTPPLNERGPELNEALVTTLNDAAVANAITAQRTVYPYLFVRDGAVLNDLGRHHVGVLASHLRDYPGPVNVRRGDASSKLYEARVEHVRNVLAAAGVDTRRVEMRDELPGGGGAKSTWALQVVTGDGEQEPLPTYVVTPASE